MCGRFSLFAPLNGVEKRFGATFVDDYQPRYNAAPGQSLPIVPDVTSAQLQDAEWGLVPTWADDRDDGGHTNARVETAPEKPSFRESFRGAVAGEATSNGAEDCWETAAAGRCLVPADGFYEWGDTGEGRRPYRLVVDDGALFAMAGLWTRWEPPQRQSGLGEFGDVAGSKASIDGTDKTDALETFTILTTEANATVEPIHDRMPVILPSGEELGWLEAADDPSALLAPYDGEMHRFAVSEAVNDPRNDSPMVAERVDG